ncbi:hypothetical protein JNK13_00180 [bacterium]|nr:hypothetical protein [bacterium]
MKKLVRLFVCFYFLAIPFIYNLSARAEECRESNFVSLDCLVNMLNAAKFSCKDDNGDIVEIPSYQYCGNCANRRTCIECCKQLAGAAQQRQCRSACPNPDLETTKAIER